MCYTCNTHSTDYKAALVSWSGDHTGQQWRSSCEILLNLLLPSTGVTSKDKGQTGHSTFSTWVYSLWTLSQDCRLPCHVSVFRLYVTTLKTILWLNWQYELFLMVNVQTQWVSPSFPATSLLLSHNGYPDMFYKILQAAKPSCLEARGCCRK